MTLLTALRLGLLCICFLVDLVTLPFVYFLTNTMHPGDDVDEEIIISKGQEPPQGDFDIFNWLLMVL